MSVPVFRCLIALGLQGLLLTGNQAAQAPATPEQILPVPYELRSPEEAPPVSVISVPLLTKKLAQHIELQVVPVRKPVPAPETPSTLPFPMKGEQALSLGKALIADGDHEGALPYLQAAVNQLPRSFDAQKELADCNYTLHHDDDAITGYTEVGRQHTALRNDEAAGGRSEVTRQTPLFGQAQFNLGQIYLDHAKFAEAAAAFTEALKIKAGDPETMTSLGIALLKQGRSSDAIPYLKQVATMQAYSADALYNLGEAYAGDSQWLPAAESFEAATRIKKLYLEPYFNRACMLYNADLLQPAIEAFLEVKKLDLNNQEAAVYMADANNRLGKTVGAVAYYREVLKSRPDDIHSLVNLSYLYIKQRQFEDAELLYKKILELEPLRADAAANLAALQTRRNYLKSAGITLRQVAQAHTADVEPHINLGAQLIVEGVYPEAVLILRRAVSLKPDSAAAQFNLGLAQTKTGAPDAAVASIRIALQLKPDWPAASYSLGLAYAALNRWDDAARAQQDAVRGLPGYAAAHYYLGQAYVRMGQKSLALQQLEGLKGLSEQLPVKLLYEINHMDEAPIQTPAVTPVPCPVISVSCPDSVDVGKPMTLTASVRSTNASVYNWSVSAGTISDGQGTPSITVNTSGLGGQTVTATLEVGGLDRSCTRTASCSTAVKVEATPSPVAETSGQLPPVTTKAEPTESPAKAGSEADCPGPMYRPSDVTNMASITEAPQPTYTEEARANRTEGKVVLRAVLCANGKVSDIGVIKDLPFGLTQQAIDAMSKVKFQPALKDGKPVSVFVTQEFNFVLN